MGRALGKSRVLFCSCPCVGQIKLITSHGIFHAVYAIVERTDTRQNQPLKITECKVLRCGSGGKAGAKRWTACGGSGVG